MSIIEIEYSDWLFSHLDFSRRVMAAALVVNSPAYNREIKKINCQYIHLILMWLPVREKDDFYLASDEFMQAIEEYSDNPFLLLERVPDGLFLKKPNEVIFGC